MRIRVFDSIGRLVTTLIDADVDAGASEVTFDASSLPSGVYFYTMETNQFVQSRRMTLLK